MNLNSIFFILQQKMLRIPLLSLILALGFAGEIPGCPQPASPAYGWPTRAVLTDPHNTFQSVLPTLPFRSNCYQVAVDLVNGPTASPKAPVAYSICAAEDCPCPASSVVSGVLDRSCSHAAHSGIFNLSAGVPGGQFGVGTIQVNFTGANGTSAVGAAADFTLLRVYDCDGPAPAAPPTTCPGAQSVRLGNVTTVAVDTAKPNWTVFQLAAPGAGACPTAAITAVGWNVPDEAGPVRVKLCASWSKCPGGLDASTRVCEQDATISLAQLGDAQAQQLAGFPFPAGHFFLGFEVVNSDASGSTAAAGVTLALNITSGRCAPAGVPSPSPFPSEPPAPSVPALPKGDKGKELSIPASAIDATRAVAATLPLKANEWSASCVSISPDKAMAAGNFSLNVRVQLSDMSWASPVPGDPAVHHPPHYAYLRYCFAKETPRADATPWCPPGSKQGFVTAALNEQLDRDWTTVYQIRVAPPSIQESHGKYGVCLVLLLQTDASYTGEGKAALAFTVPHVPPASSDHALRNALAVGLPIGILLLLGAGAFGYKKYKDNALRDRVFKGHMLSNQEDIVVQTLGDA